MICQDFIYQSIHIAQASEMSRDSLSIGLGLLRVPTTESMEQEDIGSAIQAG